MFKKRKRVATCINLTPHSVHRKKFNDTQTNATILNTDEMIQRSPPVPLRRRIEEAASSTKKWPNFRKLAGLEISENWGEREKEGGEEGVYINVGDHPPLFGYLGF